MAWALLGVAVLAVGAAAVGLLDLGTDAAPGEGSGSSVELADPASMTLFDPGGSGSESGAELPALLDGDPTTSWASVGYNSPDFGGLKPGLGFWIDLGTPHQVESVALRTDTPGISYEVRTASEPASTLEGWLEAGAQADAAELSEVVLTTPVVSRYVLVWITGDLQPDGSGRYRVQLSEMAVRGEPT